MEEAVANTSVLETNVTLEQIASALNLTIVLKNSTNVTDGVTPEKLFSLFDAYRTKEREYVMLYKSVAYVMGTLIILSNLTVVISSGLILKKGQRPKSTYLLLGNVSLADTIIGVSIIFGTLVDNSVNSNLLCIFQIGMIVCPTMVSIFSVGLIAVDRYIHIIHGLYYQRWVNTTRVRIMIIMFWAIGLCLGFVPATGWTSQELKGARCSYITLFPKEILFLNSLISLVPVVVVAVLYTYILSSALNNIRNLKAKTNTDNESSDQPKLRMYRGNINGTKTPNNNSYKIGDKVCLKRCASMSAIQRLKQAERRQNVSFSCKSKSIEILQCDTTVPNESSDTTQPKLFESKLSIWSTDSAYHTDSSPTISTFSLPNQPQKIKQLSSRIKNRFKNKLYSDKNKPCKLRAIMVVMLTSGSFIISWAPYFTFVMIFIFCEGKLENERCINIQRLLRGPLASLAFVNNLLNPMIYAWWHRGFKAAVKSYIVKCYRSYKT